MIFMFLVRKIFNRLEINKAVLFSLFAKVWGLATGPIVVLVMTRSLSAEQQGFYYTFTSILLVQMFVELGLGTVIVQVASHEWAFLKLHDRDVIQGSPGALSRLASLIRFALKWYGVSGLILTILLGGGGYFFFSDSVNSAINWEIPWISLCVITGLAFPAMPILSLLEGCNQVTSIYRFQLIQGMLNSLAIILSMVFGAGLYTPAISASVRLLCAILFLLFTYRSFIVKLVMWPIEQQINWRVEIWPFQWRVAVSWLSGYLMNLLFTPIMFHYHGATIAGQMGMTLALVGTASSFGYTWVQIRAPEFGSLIAKQRFGDLDRLFGRLALIAISFTGLGSTALWLAIFWLKNSGYQIADRILPIWPVTLLLLAEILKVTTIVIGFYLRAHKKEPLMWVSLFSGIFSALSVWQLGAYFGPGGAITGYLCVIMFICMPLTLLVFQRSRTLWHIA